MKALRLFLRDRLAAGMMAGLLAYVLVVQALLIGSAQGAMAASAADPLGVICSDIDGGIKHAGGGPQDRADCPCGALCRAASGTVAIVGEPPSQLFLPAPILSSALPQSQALRLAHQRDPGVSARAPPISI